MAELIPYPFSKLIVRMFRELDKKQSIFDLPTKKFFLGNANKDFSVKFHGKTASSPIGPASGPHTQLAQNIVLSWLGGSRIMELKTVQINDELKIPRPCIDMQNVGYNIEWSQELKVQESLEEYVKASMLIEMIAASKKIKLIPGFDKVIFDTSLGYDFAGISSPKIQNFVRNMQDATTIIENFRKEIPEEFKQFRSLNFNTKLSNTLTLSTFHGCPPQEIEKIVDFLLKKNNLNCIIKLNPVLLGKKETRTLFNDVLGYKNIHLPDHAFDNDTQWDQAVDMVGRLQETAKSLKLSFGIKFCNTLIVENHRDFFPKSEKLMYLSGPPLHVLAINLVSKWRKAFGAKAKISFSAGIDRLNFPDAVALGLTPITVCSDWLKTGGYQKQAGYFEELTKKMDQVNANSIGDYIIKSCGQEKESLENCSKDFDPELQKLIKKELYPAIEQKLNLQESAQKLNKNGSLQSLYQRWVQEAALLNTWDLVPKITQNPRYAQTENSVVPRKVGSRLQLFNCLTCDKCIPVCPNNANFTYALPQIEIPITELSWEQNQWKDDQKGKLVFNKKHQIANFADFCNECGNCDIFCPEDGGPYVLKPRFFGSLESWKKFESYDGFYLENTNGNQKVWGRIDRKEYFLETSGSGPIVFQGKGFAIEFIEQETKLSSIKNKNSTTVDGTKIDLTYYYILNWLRKAVLSKEEINYVNI